MSPHDVAVGHGDSSDSATVLERRTHRRVIVTLGSLAVLLFGFLGTWLLPVGPATGSVATALLIAMPPLVVVLAVIAARRQEQRGPYLQLAAGIACFAISRTLWFGLHWMHGEPPPFPSWPAGLWLLGYVLLLTGVVGLLELELGRVGLRSWLDALVVGLGTAAVSAAFLLDVVLSPLEADSLAAMVAVTYPILNLTLLAVVAAGVAMHAGAPTRRWVLITLGVLLFGLGDLDHLSHLAADGYQVGGLMDLAWLGGAILFSVAALDRRPAPKVEQVRSTAMLVVPATFSIAALIVLAIAPFRDLPGGAVSLAIATLVAAFGRIAIAFRDVTLLHESQHQARTDELTELGNRRAFHLESTRLLAEGTAEEPLALLLIDLDHFKEINDTLGHPIGDELLRLIGPRLQTVVRDHDRLFRLGGDEFAVLLPGLSADDAFETAHRIRDELRRPFALDDLLLHIDGSVGVAVYPDHGDNAELLLQRADVAMYLAKETRSGVQVYLSEKDTNGRDQLQLLDDLRRALRTDQLLLHYQPQWSLTKRRVIGVEALVRWQHPTDGLIAPDRFLPLVEKTGLMTELTRIVLRKAVAQCREWQDQGLELPVAVNVSAVSFLDELLVDHLAFVLESTGVDPSLLVIEITENTLVADPIRAGEILQRMRALGVRVSVDDYGTGYCSLAYLRDLPIDELKLDRTFMRDLSRDRRGEAIVRSTIELAHSLGLDMVAEGVEDQHTFDYLTGSGCDTAQGYFFSAPLPAAELEDWVRNGVATSATGRSDTPA